MKPHRIEQLAKQAGLVQGPWANGNKERIWQESRDFPDALETFADMVLQDVVTAIKKEIVSQSEQGINTNILGLNQAIFAINDLREVK